MTTIFVQYKYFKGRKMRWGRIVQPDEAMRFLAQEYSRARSWLWRW